MESQLVHHGLHIIKTCTCAVGFMGHLLYCSQSAKRIEAGVLVGFCLTWNTQKTKVVVGSCPFNIIIHPQFGSYTPVPNDLSQLDVAVCNYTHRTGQLCGQCENGTSPPVYSYYPQCVDCPAGTNNWAKYLAVSLLPTTLFFLGAVLFRLRATSPNMNGFILLCQIISSPPILRVAGDKYYENYFSPRYLRTFFDAFISYVSVWNLDFLRMVYSPFCLHPNATTLQVLSLDYIIAAYPLALIILTYTLVTLHYHNCTLVVWLWRPFLRCCIRFKRQWNIRNSLVDAFATFLLLSYVKFLSVSFDILTPSFMWDITTWKGQPTVLYYDGSIGYFSREHLPYAILAITVLLVFTLLPILLLCLYPCHCFQKLLNSCRLRCLALHTFMDAFQGYYKDGTSGTRDCRYFAPLYLITRVAVQFTLASTLVFKINSFLTLLLLIVILLLSCFQPYKKQFYNKLDIFFFVIIVSVMSLAWFMQDFNDLSIEHTDLGLLALLTLIPVLYPLLLGLYYIWKRSSAFQSATKKIKAFFSRPNSYHRLEESLPRRVTTEEAAPLLSRIRHLGSQ